MASITKRTYRKKTGKESTYWELSYYDSHGKRHRQNFDKQSKAHAKKIEVEGELLAGSHITAKGTVNVKEACRLFIADFEREVHSGKRERSTLKQYKGHVKNHIELSSIALQLLTHLQPKDCRAFLDHLFTYISDVQAAKVMVTLRMVLKFAMERGWINNNPALAVRVRKDTRKAKVIEIPPKSEVKKLLEAANEKERAFLCLGFFCGLRASEIRGLAWENVTHEIVIDQRADEWGKIGAPKTQKSRRTIPLPTYTRKSLEEWRKKAKGRLVFTSKSNTPYSYQNLSNRLWKPLFKKAELTRIYGFHVMRHVAASLWIEQGKNPKQVQELLGHSTIAMTMDTYGHLWKNEGGQEIVDAGEKSVMGAE